MSENIYTGPAKVYMGTTAFFPEGENGQTVVTVEQEKIDRASANFGRVTSLQGNAIDRIALTPFDNWGSLGALFPAYLGVKVGATAAALAVGTRPHGAAGADVAAKVWCPDGRLITVLRAAITKHPDIHLGVDKALFGPMEITGILASAKTMGVASAFHTITATGAADPGGQFTLTDFEAGAWTGAWGTVAGFGGDSGDPVQAEDEWVLSNEIKYQAFTVQKLVRCYALTSVNFMAKCRPYGPTQSQIDSAVGLNSARTLGSRFANPGYDLVLTGPGAKTITLKNADVCGEGFDFGGTKLGNGEIGFVTQMVFAAGVPAALVEFSA